MELNLGGNIGDEGCKELAKNTTITELYLSSYYIGDEACKVLAKNTTITKLIIADNNIGDEGKKALDIKKIRQKLLSSLQAICWREIEAHKVKHKLPEMMVMIGKGKYNESEFFYHKN